MKKFPEAIHVVKIRNNHYLSATSQKLRLIYAHFHNFVLSMIDSAHSGRAFELCELNGGKLLNFEVFHDSMISIATQTSQGGKNAFEFKTFLYADRSDSKSDANRSLSFSDKQSANFESNRKAILALVANNTKVNPIRENISNPQHLLTSKATR